MEHQYPGAISPDEHMLAELMLPDQTHVRTQDWTMFFLHKDAGMDEELIAERENRRAKRRERRQMRETTLRTRPPSEQEISSEDSDDTEESDVDESEGPPLMYVLNLVNTKQDSTAKRGAVVKSMAICTRHSFLHIYKPILVLALEDYFKSPVPETLKVLYDSLNAMDLSLMPRLSMLERHVLQASDTKDMFVEKFETMLQQRSIEDSQISDPPEDPESPTRPAQKYTVPRDTREFESKIVYNGIPLPVKVPVALSPELVGDFSLVKLVQVFGNPHTTHPQPFAIHPHLTTSGAYTHPVIVLLNAMLTQKRVIFLGHNRPSADVVEAVLAACALASGGVLRGFTRHAFPYTDLSKIDELLKVPGFVAGVTNPTFAYHPEWWDVLCDIPTGRIKISSSLEPAPLTEGTAFFHNYALASNATKDPGASDPTGDNLFMEDINQSIAQRQGETMIRAKFRAYVSKFTRIAAAFEETVYGASSLSVPAPAQLDLTGSTITNGSRPGTSETQHALKGHGYVWPSEEAKQRELAASAARLEGWRTTRSYYSFVSDLATRSKAPISPSSPVSVNNLLFEQPGRVRIDMYHVLSRLRTQQLSPAVAGQIYLALEAYCTDYDSILELLEQSPMSEGGLFYVSYGLWHEDQRVREAVAVVLARIRNHAAGRHFFARLGGFVNVGWMRCWQERDSRLESANDESEPVLTNDTMLNGVRLS